MFKMKNINWLLWIGIILVFILLTFFIGKLTMFIKDSIYMKNLSVEVSTETEENEEKDVSYFHSIITIPFINQKSIDDDVYDWARSQEKDFQSQLAEEEDRLFFFKKGEFTIDSAVYKLTEDIQQIKIHSNQSFKKQE